MRALLTLFLLAAALAYGAPAPRYRAKPPMQVVPGDYILSWGLTNAAICLKRDSSYTCRWGKCQWYGTWHWDPQTRTLYVAETCDGRSWLRWHAKLDRELVGRADNNQKTHDISLLPNPR